MNALLASLEVRVVPTCSDLPETSHRLLAHLTWTRKLTKAEGGAHLIRGDQDQWAQALGLSRQQVADAYAEIGPEFDRDGDPTGAMGFLKWSSDPRRGLLLWLPCSCRTESEADSSIPLSGSAARRQRHGRGASSTRSASMILPRSENQPPLSENGKNEWESPGQRPEECFPGMAKDTSEPPRKRRKGDSAYDLADFFKRRVLAKASAHGLAVLPDVVDLAMLGKHLARYRAEGIPAQQIRDMIIAFADQYPRFHKPGVDPAKVFLANRRRLFAQVQEKATFMTERNLAAYLEARPDTIVHSATDIDEYLARNLNRRKPS